MEQPKILCFTAEENLISGLEKLSRKYGVDTKAVKVSEYGMPIAAISAGIPAVSGYNGQPLPESMLVFVNFSEGSLDLFLSEMKKYQVGKGIIKAILTKHNAVWTPVQLYSELCRERAEMLSSKQ